MVRPTKAETCIRKQVSFRPDQTEYIQALRSEKRLSGICQKAVDVEKALESLPDSVRDDALEAAAQSFFDECPLSGSYAISQDELIRHEATADEMRMDAEWLGIPPGRLIPCLQDLFDLEREYALRKAAVLRKYRNDIKRSD
jgi:hypothetical protein